MNVLGIRPGTISSVHPLSCSHTYTDLGADPGGSATDVVRHCPPWSVLIPQSSIESVTLWRICHVLQYDLMLSDGGLAADWRSSGNIAEDDGHATLVGLSRRTDYCIRPEAQLCCHGETSECRSTTAAGPCPCHVLEGQRFCIAHACYGWVHWLAERWGSRRIKETLADHGGHFVQHEVTAMIWRIEKDQHGLWRIKEESLRTPDAMGRTVAIYLR